MSRQLKFKAQLLDGTEWIEFELLVHKVGIATDGVFYADGVALNAKTICQIDDKRSTDVAVRDAWGRLRAGLFAVDFYLKKPYPDDPRWTPWTRFIEPRVNELHNALADIGVVRRGSVVLRQTPTQATNPDQADEGINQTLEA